MLDLMLAQHMHNTFDRLLCPGLMPVRLTNWPTGSITLLRAAVQYLVLVHLPSYVWLIHDLASPGLWLWIHF